MASRVLRFIALAEFSGALTAWGLGVLDWGLACLIATCTLIVALGGLERGERRIVNCLQYDTECGCHSSRMHPIYRKCMNCGCASQRRRPRA